MSSRTPAATANPEPGRPLVRIQLSQYLTVADQLLPPGSVLEVLPERAAELRASGYAAAEPPAEAAQ